MGGEDRRVLHFREQYLPLSETFIHQFVTHLTRWDPVVVTGRRENAECFPVHRIEIVGGLQRGNTLMERVLRHAGRCPPVAALSTARRKATVHKEVRALLRRHLPRLVHAHFADDAARIFAAVSDESCPIITSFYGYDISQPGPDGGTRRAIREVIERGTAFLVEGPHMRQLAIKRGCAPERVHLQRIGIDLAKLPFRPPVASTKARPVRVLLSGRFVDKKGIADGVRAFAGARRRMPRLQLVLVGDGPDRQVVDEEINKCALNGDAFVRYPFMRYADYCQIVAETDIYLAPSRTAADGDTEGGAPTAILEMQAMGKPIVSTRHADIPYVVREGESGTLVEERDVEALANALADVASHDERWQTMGRAGRAHVEMNHDILKEAANLERIYDKVAEGCGQAR